MINPEKQPTPEKPKVISPEKIGAQAIKSAEQMLAEYTGNDEQYKAYLRGEYPDPRD